MLFLPHGRRARHTALAAAKSACAKFAIALFAVAAPLRADAQLPDLVLNVTDTPDPIPATGVVTFGVAITNVGGGTATGVTYLMAVPENARYQGFTAGTGAACSGMTVGQLGPGTVSCTHPQLLPNATGSFTVLLRMTAQGIATVESSVNAAQTDAIPADNTVSNATTVIAGADVSLTLSAPSTLPSGSTFNYALSVTNAGPDPATALRVQFPLPSGFRQVGALPAGCSLSGGTVTCNIAGPIASGATLAVGNIPGQITAASVSTVTATASLGLQPGAPVLTAQDPNSDNNTSARSISVTAGSDVRLTMARSVAAPYFVGNSFDFVLTAAFDGDSPSGLTITDNLPVNYTIGSVASPQNGWNCTVSGQLVTCTRASGGAAGVDRSLGTITIPVTINAVGASVTNTATIASTSPTDPTLANNTATDGGATLQSPTADLTLTKSGPNPALVVQDVAFDWTLSVGNAGPNAFFGDMTITENIPANIRINSITPNGWSCGATPVTGPAVLTCTRSFTSGARFAAGGASLSIVLNATALTAGTFTNTATLTTVNPNAVDPNTGNNDASHIVTSSTVPASADLSVINTVDLASVPAGDVLTYVIEVVNSGTSTATSVTVTDALGTLINSGVGATGQGFVGSTVTRLGVASSVNCTSVASGSNGRTVSCTIPSLPVCTASVDCPLIELAIRPGGDGGTRLNSARAVSSAVADPNTANNTGSVSSTIVPRADVTVTTSASADPSPAGQALTYVVAAINNGPSQALGVQIINDLPLNVFFVSASPASGTCTTPTANTVTSVGNRRVTCSLGTIANAAQRTVSIVVRPMTGTRLTTLQNDVTVSTTTTEPTTPGGTNNSAMRTVAVSNPSLDLLVNKTDSVDPLTIGSNTVYTITVNNNGPSDAEQVVVRDTMPPVGLSYQSHTVGGSGSCSMVPTVGTVGGVLTCTIPRIGAGTSAAVTLTMAGLVKGVHTNRVTVESDETLAGFDIALTNNRALQATSVRTRADVQVVSKIPSVPTVAVRRPYSWTIKVRNNSGVGLAEADTVVVTDTLPTGMELTGAPTMSLVSGSTTLSTCTGTVGQRTVRCSLGTLSSGGEVDITVPVRNIAVPAGGIATNIAHVATFSQDLVVNNSNSGSITITASSIGGLVYRDFNNNGSVDAGDTGIGSVPMTLSGTAFDGSAVSRTLNTANDGTYTFSDLPEGSYNVLRGTVAATYLNVGIQTAGSSGGVATTPPNISAIALAPTTVATAYRFAMVPVARLGLFKRVVGTPVTNADGSITAVLSIGVRNFSIEALSAVSITDPLAGAAPRFGTFVPGGAAATLTAGSYTINAAPSVEGTCGTATPTAAFDGQATTQIAQITTLAIGSSCAFNVTLRYRPTAPLPAGNYTNQATGTATGALSGQALTDLSQNGTDADPDADGQPGNNSVPTPLNAVLVTDVTTSLAFPTSATAGDPVTGTVRYTNNGPWPAPGMTYTLALSTGLTGVSVSNLPVGATATYSSATGVVSFTGMPTTLAVGAIASGNGTSGIVVTYTQNALASSGVVSSIGTSMSQGANVAPDNASAGVGGAIFADVTTVLSGFPSMVPPGGTVSGRVDYRNAGPSMADGTTFSLQLSAGLTNVSFGNLPAGITATYVATTGLVTLNGMPTTMAPGASISADGAAGILLSYTQPNTATIILSTIGTSTNQGANVLPDAARSEIVSLLATDLVVSKRTTATEVAPGERITYRVSVRNAGPLDVPSGSILADEASPGLSLTSVVCATDVANRCTSTPTPAALQSGLSLPPMAVGDVYELLVTALVSAPAGSGVSNAAEVTVPPGFRDEDPSNNRAVAGPTPVRTSPDLTLTKTAIGTFRAGFTASYQLTVTNVGSAATTVPIQIADLLTNALTFQRGVGTGWSCSAIQQAVTCTHASPLAPGASSSLTLEVLINSTAEGAITNRADVTTGGDVRPRNDTSAVATPVLASPDLAVVKSVDNDSLRLGTTASYTLAITNRGRGATAEAITLTDELPAGLLPIATSGSDFSCTITGQRVTCTRTAAMAPNATASVVITVAISTTLPLQPVTNTACARTATDGNDANDCGSVTTPVSGRREAELRKDAPGAFAVGQPGTFRLVVRSRGTLPLGPLMVSDTLPRGLTFLSAQGTGWSCGSTGGVVNCTTPGPIAVGDSAVVTLTTTVGLDAASEVTNCATLATPAGTSVMNGGRSCVTVRPRRGPDLLLVKTVNTDTLRLGGNATWMLTITNRGAAATSLPITVIDTLPASIALLAASGPGFACTTAGAVVQCTRTTPLAIDESVAITLTASVRANAPLQPITNVACTRTSDDVNVANDCGAVTTPTAGRVEAALRKDAVGEFLVGTTGTFRVWVKNTGTVSLAAPLVVTDSLPQSLTFVAANGTGWSCSSASHVARCTTTAPLGVGDSTSFTVQATIGVDAVPEATNCAVLSVASGAILTNGGRACVTVRPTADYRLVLELTTPRSLREVGESPDFTVLVRNVGRSPLPNVAITNVLPRGFSYVRNSSTRGGRPDLSSRQSIADPGGTAGRSLEWLIGDLSPGQVVRLDYRAMIGAGASFSSDNITQSTAASSVPGLRVASNSATVAIKLQRGLFDTRGVIAGKITMACDCDSLSRNDDGDLGIPGVRVVMEDGSGAITDSEGKYNIVNVRAGLHVVKVDRTTLPPGATLAVLNTRNAGDAYSRFVDLKAGELHRADFVEGSRSPAVLADVLARRAQGEVSAAGDSARMAATVLSPLTFTPTAVTPLTTSAPTTSVYTPLAVPNALHDGNASLPTPVTRAQAQMNGMPSDSGAGRTAVEFTPARTGVDGQRLIPALRPMMAAGLLQARIDIRQLSRGTLGISGTGDGFEETLNDIVTTRDSGRVHAGARGALLLKGAVKGNNLLTLAFDSERDRDRTQFRDITPDDGFPIFGDASLREFDAQSQQRLYARLDRGASFLRYGDFATPRADDRRLLLAYDRSLTGLTYHAENTRGVFNGFASRNGIRQTVDELPGRGLSGPYYLGTPNAVVNSERVEIVTRDRNQPAIILRTQPMSRFEEYTVEPLSGRLLFRAPVPSMDANLNPVSIRVSYEVEQGGAQFNTYGGDGRLRVGSRLELGGFAVRDENPLDRQSLFGASATAMFGAATTVLGEVARTETGVDAQQGEAWRIELRHQSARLEGRVFAMQGDSTFANRSSTFVGGRTEWGARWSATLRANLRLVAEALHTEDARTDGRRDGALLSIEQRLSKRFTAELGYRWADENGASVTPVIGAAAGGLFGGSVGGASGSNVARNLTPLSFSAARARLAARGPGSGRSMFFAEYEYGLDDSQARRGAIGGEYLLFEKSRLYLRHEWLTSSQGPYALGEGRDQQNTVFGIDADYVRNAKIFSEYRARDAFNGRDAEASIGLRNRWQLAPGVLANTTFERVSPLAGAETGRAFAATGALEFTSAANWKGTSRLEWRTSPTGDNVLGSLGYASKLSDDWTMLGRTLWDQIATQQLRGRSQLGLAWRQTDGNRVNALFRLENRLDRTDAQGEPTSRTIANVAAVLLNVQPSTRLTLSARYAGKRADDTRNGVTAQSTSQLLMGRVIADVTKRIDVGVIGSTLGNATFSERRYGVGAELGAVLMRNLRLAAGYNLFGFTDRDFESMGYTRRGPYLEFGFKFDEGSWGTEKR